MNDQPDCKSRVFAEGKRAAFCIHHGWNLTYREVRQRGCIDKRKQRGKAACNYIVKDADNIVWFNRWMKAETKIANKKKRREVETDDD
jgi:hypothetical protein